MEFKYYFSDVIKKGEALKREDNQKTLQELESYGWQRYIADPESGVSILSEKTFEGF